MRETPLSSEDRALVEAFFHTVGQLHRERCSISLLQPRAKLIVKGDEIQGGFFILRGQVNVLNQFENGKEYAYVRIGAGSMVGEMELIAGQKRFISTLECTIPTLVISYPAEVYFSWFRNNQSFAMMAATRLARMLCISACNNGTVTAYTASECVALLLLKEYAAAGETGTVTIRETREGIARRTGFSLRSVHRVIRSLAEDGYLQVEQKKIVISPACFERLRRYADSFSYNQKLLR